MKATTCLSLVSLQLKNFSVISHFVSAAKGQPTARSNSLNDDFHEAICLWNKYACLMLLVLWSSSSNIKLKEALKSDNSSNLFFFFFYLHLTKTEADTTREKKDKRHFCRRLWVCNFAGLCRWVMVSFFPREKWWRVSSLMCFTWADLISRPGPSHGRQISFSPHGCHEQTLSRRRTVLRDVSDGWQPFQHPYCLSVFVSSSLTPNSQHCLFLLSTQCLSRKKQN